MVGGSSPGRGWEFFLHHRVQSGYGAHPASYPMSTGCCFPKECVEIFLQSPSMPSWRGAQLNKGLCSLYSVSQSVSQSVRQSNVVRWDTNICVALTWI